MLTRRCGLAWNLLLRDCSSSSMIALLLALPLLPLPLLFSLYSSPFTRLPTLPPTLPLLILALAPPTFLFLFPFLLLSLLLLPSLFLPLFLLLFLFPLLSLLLFPLLFPFCSSSPSPSFWVFKLSLCCFESEVVWPLT